MNHSRTCRQSVDYFNTQLQSTLRDNMLAGHNGWTNNNYESINYVLKVTTQWRRRQLPGFIDHVCELINAQCNDTDHALCGLGILFLDQNGSVIVLLPWPGSPWLSCSRRELLWRASNYQRPRQLHPQPVEHIPFHIHPVEAGNSIHTNVPATQKRQQHARDCTLLSATHRNLISKLCSDI